MDELRALPKVDLHCHLDGSPRLGTLLEIAAAQGVNAESLATLGEVLTPGKLHGSLEAYLAVFPHILSALQTESALERAAFELAEDASAENVRWIEARYCPTLCQAEGLSLDAVVGAVRAGLQRAHAHCGIESGQIISALRHHPPKESLALARLALRHKASADQAGAVVGFDLAGPEQGHPAIAHAAAFALARDSHLWRTCHAGEAAGPESIAEALSLGINRLGHAVALDRAPDLVRAVIEQKVVVEACLSSNVQTGAVENLAVHPLPRLLAAGVRVTLCTDNRLVSGTTVSQELDLAQQLGLSREKVLTLVGNGIDGAFLPPIRRAALQQELAAHSSQSRRAVQQA